MFWNNFIFGELRIWLKSMFFLEFLFLSLPRHLLLFKFHQVSLMHKEVGWIHDLLILHVFLSKAHLSCNLPFSFIGKIRWVRCNLRLETQLIFLLLLLNALLEFKLSLVKLQSIQVVDIKNTLDLLDFDCPYTQLSLTVFESKLSIIGNIISRSSLMLGASAFKIRLVSRTSMSIQLRHIYDSFRINQS